MTIPGNHLRDNLFMEPKNKDEALALPEPSEPDPAQELLASVQLKEAREYLSHESGCEVYPMPLGTCNCYLSAIEPPNKADAGALVRVLRAAESILKNSHYSTQKAVYFVSIDDFETLRMEMAATPLIKQIAGGG